MNRTLFAMGAAAVVALSTFTAPAVNPAAAQSAANDAGAKPEASPMRRVPDARKAARINGEDGRVIGGTEAASGAWPFQVALLTSRMLDADPVTQSDAQFCGGSLIAPEWVLTAAHCLVDWGFPILPEDVTILAGATELTEGERLPVAEVIIHEDYDPGTFDSDIGLIRLAQPAGQKPVKLTPGDVPTGGATVTGWGRTDDGSFPGVLMQADIELFPNENCNSGIKEIYKRDLTNVLSNYGFRMRISPENIARAADQIAQTMADPLTGNMICAGTTTGQRDACNGDSGGPLFVNGNGGPMQVGIVSWGEGPLDASMACGHANAYGVYTRVSSFKDWIAEKTGVK